jgi:hypothetical protein
VQTQSINLPIQANNLNPINNSSTQYENLTIQPNNTNFGLINNKQIQNNISKLVNNFSTQPNDLIKNSAIQNIQIGSNNLILKQNFLENQNNINQNIFSNTNNFLKKEVDHDLQNQLFKNLNKLLINDKYYSRVHQDLIGTEFLERSNCKSNNKTMKEKTYFEDIQG